MKTRGVKIDFKELNACIPVCSLQKANTRKILKRDVLPGQYDVERLITKRKKSGVNLGFWVGGGKKSIVAKSKLSSYRII